MQCRGIILNKTADLHLVLILLRQVRPFATGRLVKEDNSRLARKLHGTGIVWQNSALDRRKFYDIKSEKLAALCIFLYFLTFNIKILRCRSCLSYAIFF